MNTISNVHTIASLVSEASRAAILTVLLDGRFHTASELASAAGIKPQTASFHLAKMIEANAIVFSKQGRHHYYAILDQEVAQVMESLLTLAPPIKVRSFKQSTEDQAIRYARTCYDHLAGSVGVQLTDALLEMGYLSEEFNVTEKGEDFFKTFRIDLEAVKRKRRSFSHQCLDWSERRHHLAGALGTALLERFIELNWIQRVPNTRAIQMTQAGKIGFQKTFSITL